jgi:hypothetical protein
MAIFSGRAGRMTTLSLLRAGRVPARAVSGGVTVTPVRSLGGWAAYNASYGLAGLDEGLPSLSLRHSRLYGESL